MARKYDAVKIPKTDTIADHFRELYLSSETFPQLLYRVCESYPYFPALRLLNKDGKEVPSHTRTYAQLAHQAMEIADWMKKEQGVERGDRVMMVFFPSVEFMVGLWACYLGGFIAIPISPPVRLQTDLPNFNAMVNRSEAKLCLSHNAYYNFSTMQSISDTVTGFLWTRSQVRWPDLHWMYIDKACRDAGSPPAHHLLLERLKRFSSKISRDDTAYLQMTSGSTSLPKLVQCVHNAALYNSIAITGWTDHMVNRVSEENYQRGKHPWGPRIREDAPPDHPEVPEYHRTTVVWVPHYHDFFMGLHSASFLFCTTFCVMSPMDFLANPLVWIKALVDWNGTLTCAPNFAFDYVVSKTREKDRLALMNSNPVWRTAICQGGEAMQAKSLDNFLKFLPFISIKDFHNAYGMAEALAGIVSQQFSEKAELRRYIPKGFCSTGEEIRFLEEGDPSSRACFSVGNAFTPIKRGVENTRVIIVHPETHEELPERHVGEVWASSPMFGRGYYGWSETDNQDVFEMIPTECITAEPHRLFLRTGDRGFADGGKIFLIGRFKGTLILRGRNFEPSDIEYTVWNSHEKLRPGCTVALSVPNEDLGTDELVFIAEVRDETLGAEDFDEIGKRMRHQLAESFGLLCPEILFFGPKKGVEKTKSGKPRRNAIFEKYLEGCWKPLYVSKVEGEQIPVDYFSEKLDIEFPEGAEEAIEKIMEDLGRAAGEGEEEEGKEDEKSKRLGLSVLDEKLQAFSVASSDLVRLQSLVNSEFGVYVPSGVLLSMDMNITVRQFFHQNVFSPEAQASVASPKISRSASPSRSRPSSPSRSRASSPSKSRASSPSKSRRAASPSRPRQNASSPRSASPQFSRATTFSASKTEFSLTSRSSLGGISRHKEARSPSPTNIASPDPSPISLGANRSPSFVPASPTSPNRHASMGQRRADSFAGKAFSQISPSSPSSPSTKPRSPPSFQENRSTSFVAGSPKRVSIGPSRTDSNSGSFLISHPNSPSRSTSPKGSRLSSSPKSESRLLHTGSSIAARKEKKEAKKVRVK